MDLDLTLMLVADLQRLPPKIWRARIEAAVAGGVTCVQLREKGTSLQEFYEHAAALKDVLDAMHVPLLINDAVELAAALDLAGAHVGEDDMSPLQARRLLGPHKVLGVSITSADSFAHYGKKALTEACVHYYGVGPVFSTMSKNDAAPPLGLAGVEALVKAFDKPSIAIGGINLANVGAVMRAGVGGVAVISALWDQDDIETAARNLKAALIP